MKPLRILLAALSVLALASCAAPGSSSAPAAQVERLEIVSRGPAFGGAVFEDVGQYETIVAVAHMRINPRHNANRGIADIDKAPAPDGWVRYQTDVIILRPHDAARASRVLLLDVPNRGGKLFQYMVNEGSGAIDTAAGAGSGYAMRRGHTLVWIGWQGDIALGANGKVAGTAFPVATMAGKPITGASQEEVVFDDIKPTSAIALAYPAASLDQRGATLTVRATAGATPTVLPVDSWRYTSPTGIELTRPRGFDAGAIYRFRYEARDPTVMGLGMAALRDVTSYLKSGAPDAAGQPNPLADIKPAVALAVGVSQSGRFLRDLVWQGFNADPRGGKVFDGAMPLIAGSRKSFVNLRFAQPGRYSTQHLDHITYGDQFPFSYGVTTDPVGGATDGIFARCQASATCPKLMHVDSSLEFWQARASLVVTDGAGKDIALPSDVRVYLMASTQHVYATTPTVGICKYPDNAASQAPIIRALLERLVAWSRDGTAPPASRFPRIGDAMLVAPQREAVGFPDLGAIGVIYPALINELTVVDYSGGLFGKPDPDKRYQVLVPMADQDGHDIAGIRSPDIAVPVATHAGWNLRRAGFAEGQLCGLNGMQLAFAATPREGDPRRALSQRYPTRLEYAKAVAIAARELRDQGLLLDEDANRYIERARR
ncbi:MAG TPA: alpha/beta hydrolase domain-containing protein [Telluria sp.]|nr:alpha/beta hydrolase domain-containing protein [Telluria sp.]